MKPSTFNALLDSLHHDKTCGQMQESAVRMRAVL